MNAFLGFEIRYEDFWGDSKICGDCFGVKGFAKDLEV